MSTKPLLPTGLAIIGGGVGAIGGPVSAGVGAGLGSAAGHLVLNGSEKAESEVRVLKALTTGDVEGLVSAKLEAAKDEGFFDGILSEIYGVIKLCVIGCALWVLVPMGYTHWREKKQKETWNNKG